MYHYPVKSCGEKGLQDTGRRDLDEEICARLCDHYQDWKSPKGTHMVPRTFMTKAKNQNIGDITEKHFYDILREFGEIKKEPMFVIHSHKFSEYIPAWLSNTVSEFGKMLNRKGSNWVMGEHDFVILHHVYGIVFFQVKATKTSGGHQKADEQIQKDKLSLLKFLQSAKKISNKQAEKIFDKFPAFVVLPNTQRGQSICAQDHVIYYEDCSSTEAFSKWWYGKFTASGEHSKINQTTYEFLVMRFVGMVHLSPLLGDCVARIEETLIFKTKEQIEILMDCHPPNLWIRGPAGSGKTMLLLEKAVSLASSILEQGKEEKILIVCFNTVLCMMLRSKLETILAKTYHIVTAEIRKFLYVCTFSKLIQDVLRSNQLPSSQWEKEKVVREAIDFLSTKNSRYRRFFDHILVDEGQDLFGRKWPELLKLMHKSSPLPHCNEGAELEDLLKPNGYFWVMYDINQYLYFTKEQTKSLSGYLQNSANLKKVLRNTGNIFKQSAKYFKPSMTPENGITLGHQEHGLEIKWDSSLASRMVFDCHGADSILSHVNYLLGQCVQARDICILVESAEKGNSLSVALNDKRIETQTADSLVAQDANKIVVESIRRFKGLESKVVILYNPPYEDDSRINGCTKELLYTAVSRCSCYLIVITTQAGCRALRSDQGIQEITGNIAQQVQRQSFPIGATSNASGVFDEMTPYPRYDQAENREPFQFPMDIDTV